MHVQTTTARIDNFHRATPFHRAASDASKKRKSPTRALRNFWRLQFVVLPSVPAIRVSGLCERQSSSTSVANAAAQTLRHLGPFSSFVLAPGDHNLLVTHDATKHDLCGLRPGCDALNIGAVSPVV